MNDITLATLIEQKFRAEALGDLDAYKYLKNDWLIDAIIGVLKAHPEIKERINIDKMSLNQVICVIEKYFKEKNNRRKLKQEQIFKFIKSHDDYRIEETLLLLLMLGFTFRHAHKRLENNQKGAGEILDLEPSLSGAKCNVHFQIKMPIQKKDPMVKLLYDLIVNDDVPSQVIDSEFENLNAKLNHSKNNSNNKRSIYNRSKK